MKATTKVTTAAAKAAQAPPPERPLTRTERQGLLQQRVKDFAAKTASAIAQDQMDWRAVEKEVEGLMSGLTTEEQTWAIQTIDSGVGRLLSALPRVPSLFNYSGVLNG